MLQAVGVPTDVIERGEAMKQAIEDEKKAAAKEAKDEAATAKAVASESNRRESRAVDEVTSSPLRPSATAQDEE